MLTGGDFGKYTLPAMVKEVDINVRMAMKGPAEWKSVFVEGKATKEYVESVQTEAMTAARLKMEGSVPAMLRLYEGYRKRKAVLEYGARVEYTKRAKRIGNPKNISKQAAGLSDSPRQLLDSVGMAYLEYADTALASVPTVNGLPMIDSLGGDGLVLAHVTHTFASDSVNTYSNKTSSLQSLTGDTLQAATDAIMGWKNNVGDIIEADVKELLIPIAHQAKAYELLHSETKSETANRADNPLRQHFGRFGFKVLRKITTATEWFLTTNVENDYEFLFAWKPEQETDYNPLTGIHSQVLDFAFAHGVNDPRHIYFNKA